MFRRGLLGLFAAGVIAGAGDVGGGKGGSGFGVRGGGSLGEKGLLFEKMKQKTFDSVVAAFAK